MVDLDRLVRFVVGECSAEEAAGTERWIAADPSRAKLVDELRTIWVTADVGPSGWDAESAWAQLSPKLDAGSVSRRPLVNRTVWRIAAAVGLVVGIASLYRTGTLARAWEHLRPGSKAAMSMHEYTTPRGKRADFRLPDGTRLVLAPASRLRVPAAYGRRTRDVYLEGEALFDVVHQATRPFRVHVKEAIAEDIGTRFDMRGYPEDSMVAVAVAEGVVALGPATTAAATSREAGDTVRGTVLRRGNLGLLAPDGRVTMASGAAAEPYLSWVDGRLYFNETPLPQVLQAVHRWYDLDVRIGTPSLAARTITADFSTQTPDEVVRVLAFALDARADRVGRVVTLHPKR